MHGCDVCRASHVPENKADKEAGKLWMEANEILYKNLGRDQAKKKLSQSEISSGLSSSDENESVRIGIIVNWIEYFFQNNYFSIIEALAHLDDGFSYLGCRHLGFRKLEF